MARSFSDFSIGSQSFALGKNWGIYQDITYTGGCLSPKTSTGFNVWTYFKELDDFEESAKIVTFKDPDDHVLFAVGYDRTHLNDVYLFFNYATQDNQGNITYLPDQPAFTDLQMCGKWYPGYADYKFSTTGITNQQRYRATIYFYVWDDVRAAQECISQGQMSRPEFDNTLSIFNGYISASLHQTVLTKHDVMSNMGEVVNDVFQPIPAPFSDQYASGTGAQYFMLPMEILTNNTSVEVLHNFDDDTNGAGGGEGYDEYGYSGEGVDFHTITSKSASDCGMITMYDIDKNNLKALSAFLWSSNFFDNIIKLLQDPMDAIVMLGIVPLDLTGLHEASQQVYVGNVATPAIANPLSSQYLVKDMGSVEIGLNWYNALDYEPFCKADMYLPYIGVVPLSINEIMGSEVTLKYYIDLFTGDCVAEIRIEKLYNHRSEFKHVVYHHRGNLLTTIQMSGKNYSNFYSNLLNTALSVGESVASPMSGIKNGIQGAMNTAMSLPHIQKAGSFSGSTAVLMNQTPSILISRPRQQMPDNYGKYVGYPTYRTLQLKSLKGFVQCEAVIDNTVSATDTEKEMIEQLLKEGVYV